MMKKNLALALVLALICMMGMAAAEGKLLMGSSIDFAPYEYYDDETGDIVGIDVEIAYAVAEKLGVELEIVDMQFDSIIAAVTSGKVDFGMSGFTVTEERKLSVNFSTPYTTSVQSIIVPEGSSIVDVADIFSQDNAFKIGVQIGTTGDLFISEDVETKGLKHDILQYNKAPDAIVALNSGAVDCVIIDGEVAAAFVAANEGLKLLDSAYALEEYAICFAKDSAVYEQFDQALQELIADGSVQSIIDKYID